MTYHYSHHYYPPAPMADITVISVAEGLRVGPLSAFIDSGADGTIIPIRYLDEIRAPSTTEMTIRSQWGDRYHVLLYLVDLQMGDITIPGLEVVGDEIANEVILGRDVLNRLQLLLDGPRERIKISA